MPPPSPLAIATSSVRRLLKEEASYHKELEDEEVKVKDLEEKIQNGEAGDDENNDYLLRQLVREPPLRQTLGSSLTYVLGLD